MALIESTINRSFFNRTVIGSENENVVPTQHKTFPRYCRERLQRIDVTFVKAQHVIAHAPL